MYVNNAAYRAHIQNITDEEERKNREKVERAARERQKSKEIEKRAVEVMAKQDQDNTTERKRSKKTTESGVEAKKARLQTQSYLPSSNEEKVESVEKPTPKQRSNDFKFYEQKEPQNDSKYPKSIFDLASPRLTMDSQTGKVNWGQSIQEQEDLLQNIEKTPLMQRTQEDANYYEQLKTAYLDEYAEKRSSNNNIYDGFGYMPTTSTRIYDGSKGPKQTIEAVREHGRWVNNTISYHNQQKNKVEISTYQGQIYGRQELRGHLQNVYNYQKLADQLADVEEHISNLIGVTDIEKQKNILSTLSPEKQSQYQQLKNYADDLRKRLSEASEQARVAGTYLDKSIADPDLTSTANINASSAFMTPGASMIRQQDIIYKTTVEDLVKDLNTYIKNHDIVGIRSISSKLNQIGTTQVAKWDQEDEESREGMRDNMQELEEWKKWHAIDPEYLARAEAASQELRFDDPDTYLYGLAGLFGSSASFNGLQWANTILSTAGGMLSSTGAGAIVGAPIIATGFGLGMMSGMRENEAEMASNVESVFQDKLRSTGQYDEFITDAKKKLGKNVTYEEAMQAMALGEYQPSEKIKKTFVNSTFGVNNLFKHDMMAVTGDNIFETVISVVPFGKFGRSALLKPTKGTAKLRRIAAFKKSHPGLYKATEHLSKLKFSEKGYQFGATISPVMGVGTAALDALTKPAQKWVGNKLADNVVSRYVTSKLSKKFGTIADWAWKAPKTLLNSKVLGRSGKDWVARIIGKSFSESIEEGKQYYNGKQFAAGNYAGESDSVWELLLNDIEGGSKSALQFTGSFIGMTSDKEWLTNMRGGFLAGGGHVAVRTAFANANNAAKEIQANNLVINNILATKLQERADIEKGRMYAAKSSFSDRRVMNQVFDNVKTLQQQITARGEELENPDMVGISDEAIEEQRQMYNRIFNLANDREFRAAAEARGIQPGSDKYATLVSLYDFTNQEAKNAINGISTKTQDIRKTISQTLWGGNIDTMSDDEILEAVKRNGVKIKTPQKAVLTNDAIAEIRQTRRNALNNRTGLVDYIAHLDALLSMRDQIELKDNKTTADKRKLRSINNQIQTLRDSVKDQYETIDGNGQKKINLQENELSIINTASELQKYVYDIDLHEVIRDQYRDVSNYTIDLDHALSMQYNLIGETVAGVEQVNDQQINELLTKIDSKIREQYIKTAAFTDNKDAKQTDTGYSAITVNKKAAKKANKVIDDYIKSVKDDEQFEQEIHDDMQRALEELYGTPSQELNNVEDEISEPTSGGGTIVIGTPPSSETPVETPEEKKEGSEESPTPEELPKRAEEPVSIPGMVEMTTEPAEEIGDIQDYIDSFPLRSIAEDEMKHLSDVTKSEIERLVDDLNKWIQDVSDATSRDQSGRISQEDKKKFIERYIELNNRAHDLNERADSEIKLAQSAESRPKNTTPDVITYDDLIDAETPAAKKWLDDFYATLNSKLSRVKALVQTLSSSEEFSLTPEGIQEMMQAISDLDAIFDMEEVSEGLIEVDPSIYSWYFGDDKNLGARKTILYAASSNGGSALPPPVIPQPPKNVSFQRGTAQFDESHIDDPSNWGLLSNTSWDQNGKGGGVSESVSTSNSTLRLVDVIGEDDFMDIADLEIIFQGNNQPFLVVHYKGHTFTPVFIQTAQGQNRSRGYRFWSNIKTALNTTNSNQMVVPVKVSRSLGKEKRTDDKGNLIQPKSLFEVGLITEDNMYTFEFSPAQDTFGITEENTNTDGVSVIRVYTPSIGGKGHQAVYEYTNSSDNNVEHGDKPAPGVPIYLYDRHYNELGGRKAQVPINMMFTKLTEGDAELILQILKGEHCKDKNAYGVNMLAQEYVQYDDRGNLIEYGMTNLEVLNLLLRYGYKYPTDRRHIHLEYNDQDNRKVSLVGFVEGLDKFDPSKPDVIPSREFNLFNEIEAQEFVKAIAGVVNRNFSQQYASSRVGDNYAETSNPFNRLNQKRQSSLALQKMLENGGKIKFGNSAIEFDMKDFVDEANPKSTGVSGMVWYARHGFLLTRFNGFENTILVFDEDQGVKIVDRKPNTQGTSVDRAVKQNEELPKVDIQDVSEQPDVMAMQEEVDPTTVERKRKKQQIIIDDDELAKREEGLPAQKDRVSYEEAKQHIIDILGDKFFTIEEMHQDLTVEQAINMFKNGPVALGLCRQSMIRLSHYARRGTEYHEAFHRVVEILLNDKQRDKVYEAYAKAKHIKLHDKNGKIITANMKAVTEGLADEFMLYMTDRPTVKLTWNLKQLWTSIKNWVSFYRNIGSYSLYKLYRDVNRGKYKNIQPTEANKKRFEKLLETYKNDALNFTIGGRAFKYILNHRQYKNLCDTMLYILYQSQKNIDRAGRNMQDFKMDDPNVIRNYKLFQKYSQINPALSEMLDNWDVVRKDIRTKVEQIATKYVGTNDDIENVEDMQGDEASVANAGIGDHTRDSQEFSQFSRAGEKVKHFFSLIPAVKYAYNEDGKRVIVSINNAEGLPHFVNPSTMYNTVLNQVYNCRSLTELIERLEKLGKENAQFQIIYDRIEQLKKSADAGNVEDATLLTQMCVNLHASKGEYVICKAKRLKNGGFDLVIQSTDSDYAARNNRYEWSSLFAGGASKYITQDKDGNYIMKGSFKSTVFKTLADFMKDFKRAVSPIGINSIGDKSKPQFSVPVKNAEGKLAMRDLDITNEQDLAFAKSKFINILNNLGIIFNVDMLNYMLFTKYGSTDYQALNKLFTEDSQTDIEAFANFINGFNDRGRLNVVKTDNGWNINGRSIGSVFNSKGAGFVGLLSTWAYNYKKSQDQLSVLANKQNRQYLISENNYLTDAIDDMNMSIEGDFQKIDDLKGFVYNWFKPSDGPICGSIILKNYSSKTPNKLRIVTNAGFKTDIKGDIGEDYAEISQIQDEVSKIEMLLAGKIILPTMSDKKTWGYIDGITLPGLNMKQLVGSIENTVQVNPNGSYVFFQNKDVLNQLRQYAILEYQAVLQTLRDVKGYTDPVTGIRTEPLADNKKIANYHKAKATVKGKTYSIIQGARFSTLYAIYDAKGRKISFNKVCDENGNFVSEEDNIATAMEHFFGIPSETPGNYWIYDNNGNYVEVSSDELIKIQNQILSRSLQLQLNKQLQKAEKLGLIERTTNDKSVPLVFRYKNKLLSNSTVNAVKKAITQNLSDSQKESLAIAIIMNDVSCKSIMSLQETERIFSGHPSFYKWKYNKKGELQDRSADQHKRFGGLVSTGQNNSFVFNDLPRTYKAAEINDVEIQSEHVETIQRLMYEGELRSAYLRFLLNEIGATMNDSKSEHVVELAKKADETPIVEIESKIPEFVLESVKRTAKQKSDAFRKSKEERLGGINVADGATYITDDMCENLLKQVGAYGEDIQRAFKVLRGEEVNDRTYSTKGVREMLSAWNLIYTTVIGTQKYTAYGFRKQNGVLVPYYNKTALFPMFKALCTGKTAKLYEKMKKDGVDMVMLNSAVKVGSQGSQDINWDNFDDNFQFNIYEQEYRYLRKQFNTDPKEKELMAMGTQMTKIIMSAMLPGRNYVITDPDGSKRSVNAIDLRDEIMNSINKLSQIGYDRLRKQLFNGDELNIERFSEFLIEELSSRGASRDLLDAVSVVDENSSDIDEARRERIRQTGKKELKVPLSALSGMNWIQSIINSKVNKSVIDINTPGAAFIQRSVLGMEGPTTMISDKNLPPDIYEGRKLAFRNENGSMDCVLSIDFFEHVLPPNLSFEEARQWLIDNKIISGTMSDGTWSDADASIIGYRIPTQAQSSIHALRVVDVLPVVRDTVVLPAEFTKITGSDFDIDKLFLSTIYYKKHDVVDGSGNILSRTVSKEWDSDTEEYYVNRLILDQIALLKDSKSENNTETRSMHYGDASIDCDTEPLIAIVEDLEQNADENLDPYDTYSLWRNTSIRDQFITGKFGIGPFALNNNNHILTMLYGLRFASNSHSILGITGHESLCDHEDMYGHSIMSWLSGLINAHVDVAKDPYISKLNVNKYTYNLVNLMIRTGFGKSTFYFTTQPILKELALRVNNAASAYGTDSNKSKYRRQKDAEEQFIVDFANSWLYDKKDAAVKNKFKNTKEVLDYFQNYLRKLGTSKTALIKSIFSNKSEVLRQLAKSGKSYTDSESVFNIQTEKGTVQMSMRELQLLMYAAKVDFDPYSDAISKLVKYCKIDTKKHGKNIAEQRSFVDGYRRLFINSRSKLRKLFDGQALDSLCYSSYIHTKTSLATKLFRDILSPQLIEATAGFNSICEQVVMNLPIEQDEVSQQTVKKVSDSVLTSIRSDFFNSYADRFGINIRNLVNGDNTIYDRLNRLKIDILTKEEYEDLRNADGSIDNYLIQMLTSGFMHKQAVTPEEDQKVVAPAHPDTYNNAKFISTMTFMDDDSIDADEVSAAWEELLEDTEHPELQQFARDLIVYSFITTGGNGGSNNIFKYIPVSWLINPDNAGYQNSYAYYIAQKLEFYSRGASMYEDFMEDIILNNWTDNQFIPTVSLGEGFESYYTGRPYIDVVNGQQVAPQVDIPIIIKCNSLKANSKFIKINRMHDKESQRSVAIYKKVKIGRKKVEYKDNEGETHYSYEDINIYVLTNPKGQNFGNRNRIYEYGREDSTSKETAKLLGLNKGLIDIAQLLGADITSVENVLDTLVSFLDSKTDKEGALEVIKSSGVTGVLYDTMVETTINMIEDEINDVFDDPTSINFNDFVEDGQYAPEEFVTERAADEYKQHLIEVENIPEDNIVIDYYPETEDLDAIWTVSVIQNNPSFAEADSAPINAKEQTLQALRDWYKFAAKHITFNRDEHKYYIDGNPIDVSATGYAESIYGKKNIKGDYSHSVALGNTMDSLYRDFFEKGEEAVKSKTYPNLNDSRKQQILQDLHRLQQYLEERFGEDFKVITTEFPIVAYVEGQKGIETIAGTIDMMVVDKEGNIHIFDFKTKSHPITQTYNGKEVDDRRDYTAQQNLYKSILETLSPELKNKVKSLQLVWLDTSYPKLSQANYTTDKQGNVTMNGRPIAEDPAFITPSLKEDVKESIIHIDITSQVENLNVPQMTPVNTIVDQLLDHMKSTGLDVRNKDDMKQFFDNNPNAISGIQESIAEQKEIQEIKDKAIADGTFMKAPNGNPTNLTERQWLQVRTKAFKNWFGDWENDPQNASKVVDENGEPLVVYHSSTESFNEFKHGVKDTTGSRDSRNTFFFSSDKNVSSWYTDMLHGINKYTYFDTHNLEKRLFSELTNNDKPVYINDDYDLERRVAIYPNGVVIVTNFNQVAPTVIGDITNISNSADFNALPYEIQDSILNKVKEDVNEELADDLYRVSRYNYDRQQNYDIDAGVSFGVKPLSSDILDKYFTRSFFLNIRDIKRIERYSGKRKQSIVDDVKQNKDKDGFVIVNTNDSATNILSDIYAVRKPNQIKSATDNVGTFSTENDDIQAFIGKRARAKFEEQLIKARPDLAVYVVEGIIFTKDRFSDDFIANILDTATSRRLQKEGIIRETMIPGEGILTDKGKEIAQVSYQKINAALDFLHELEDNKENTVFIKTAIRWMINGSVTLPQDYTKMRQVFDTARKRRIDIQKYRTLGDLIASDEMKAIEKEKRVFDPDKAKTFSNKRTVTTEGGRVFTVYDVENTYEAQREVCKAVAAHYEVSPWCLSTFTATGEPTQSAKNHWNTYGGIKRRIAFENGKPVAFSSDKRSTTNQYEIDGRILPANSVIDVEQAVTRSVGKKEFDPETFNYFIENGYIERNSYYDYLFYNDTAYRYTQKGINASKEISSELEDREAWWDVEDIHPQDTLSDSIVSDPKAIGRGEINALHEDLEAERIEHEQALIDMYTQEDVDAYGRPMQFVETLNDDLPFYKTPQGEVYGFVDKDDNIYLDETIITPEHPIHEYTHLWDRYVAKNNPQLWKRGIALMKQTSLWNEVANDPNYGLKWKSMENMSESRLESLIASEVHSRIVGKEGAALLDKLAKEKGQKNIISKLKEWILEFWKELKATFSNWSEEDLNKLTLDDFTNMTVRDFVEGINPIDTDIKHSQIQKVVQIHKGNWSRQEAINNPNILYVFTDNTDRDSGSGAISDNSWYSKKYGTGHHFPTVTAAVVRGLDNSRPISTQRWYHQGAKGTTGRWTDADVEEFRNVIGSELQDIVDEFNTGKYDTIMFPGGNGLFNTNISNITKTRTPQLYQALADLLHEYGFDSLIPTDVKPSQIQGENISSSGSEFARQLTNPGNTLQVEYNGTVFRNAEHAYQTWKSGEFDEVAYKNTSFKPVGSKKADFNTNYHTMVDILIAKLQQHPHLIEGIKQRGGVKYLQASTHNVTGDKYWETSGKNKFIEALIEAYNNATQVSDDITTRTNPAPEIQFAIYTYQAYYQDQFSKNDFIRNKVSQEAKGTDFVIEAGKNDLYNIMRAKNILKYVYTFEEMKNVACRMITKAGGNPKDFNFKPSKYGNQSIMITGRKTLYLKEDQLKSQLKQLGEKLMKECE